MTLKLRILKSLTRLFIILVSLMISVFSKKYLFSIDALMVWCLTWSKNLGWFLISVQSSYDLIWIIADSSYFFTWNSNQRSTRDKKYSRILIEISVKKTLCVNFKAVLALPKTVRSAQTHKSINFIWIVCSTLYV